eukprot:jgi/Bigna1/86534/estExt_fgenesh1_pg.C_110130
MNTICARCALWTTPRAVNHDDGRPVPEANQLLSVQHKRHVCGTRVTTIKIKSNQTESKGCEADRTSSIALEALRFALSSFASVVQHFCPHDGNFRQTLSLGEKTGWQHVALFGKICIITGVLFTFSHAQAASEGENFRTLTVGLGQSSSGHRVKEDKLSLTLCKLKVGKLQENLDRKNLNFWASQFGTLEKIALEALNEFMKHFKLMSETAMHARLHTSLAGWVHSLQQLQRDFFFPKSNRDLCIRSWNEIHNGLLVSVWVNTPCSHLVQAGGTGFVVLKKPCPPTSRRRRFHLATVSNTPVVGWLKFVQHLAFSVGTAGGHHVLMIKPRHRTEMGARRVLMGMATMTTMVTMALLSIFLAVGLVLVPKQWTGSILSVERFHHLQPQSIVLRQHHQLPVSQLSFSRRPLLLRVSAADWEQRARSRDAKKASQMKKKTGAGSASHTSRPSTATSTSNSGSNRPPPSSSRSRFSSSKKNRANKQDKRTTEAEEDMRNAIRSMEKYEQQQQQQRQQQQPQRGIPGGGKHKGYYQQQAQPQGIAGSINSAASSSSSSSTTMRRMADGKVADEDVDARTEETLEFPVLRTALMQRCKTYRGQGLALSCLEDGATSKEEAIKLYQPVEELIRLGGGEVVPVRGSIYIDPLLEKVRDRFPLELEELAAVGEALGELGILQDWIMELRESSSSSSSSASSSSSSVPDTPALQEVCKDLLKLDSNLRELFEGAFEGEHLSSVKFPQLKSLQKKIDTSEKAIRMLENNSVDRINGRFVLCVKPNYKRRVGIAHDSSRSGKSLFIEPFQVVEATNELTDAQRELRMEESKILSKMQAQLLINSKAVSEAIGAAGALDLCRANPLLALRGVDVVPNQVEINATYPGLIITGPNAGGKTIILKSLGLYALMTRVGIPLPCEKEGTRVDLFRTVVASIGDSQTAEGDLSTFSGHLSVWDNALKRADESTLLLMDEMGTGTDPTQGAALAQAMMEAYADEGARLVVTTHYSQIKQFAASDERFSVSGMMIVNGRPTYHMTPGFASESHAISIAERLQMPDNVIERAKSLIDENTREMLTLMEQLQDASDKAKGKEDDHSKQQDMLKSLEEEVREKTLEIEETRKNVRAEAAAEYAKELQAKERRLNNLVKELQEAQRKQQNNQKQQGTTSVGEDSALGSNGGNIVGDDINTLKVLKREVQTVKEEVRAAAKPMYEEQGLVPLTVTDVIEVGDQLAIIDGGTFDKRIASVTRVRGRKIDVTITRGRIPFQLTLDRSALAYPSEKRLKMSPTVQASPAASTLGGGVGMFANVVHRQAKSMKAKEKSAAKNSKKALAAAAQDQQQLRGIRTPGNTVDVRGMSLPDAKEDVVNFISDFRKSGEQVAYIAHGHGTGEEMGVLKNGLREWLQSGKAPVSVFEPAAMEDGGDAFTIIALK